MAAIAANAQTPNVVLHFAPDTAQKTIRVINNIPRQTFHVDWGDGRLIAVDDVLTGEALVSEDQRNATQISGYPVGDRIVKLYGEGITFLHIAKQDVDSLDVTNAPDVQYLFLSNNPDLKHVDFSHNGFLAKVLITNTGIEDADFSGNPELTDLQATSGNVRTVNLSNNRNLKNLTLAKCHLDSIDLSACDSLTIVKLQQNNIQKVTFPSFMSDKTKDSKVTINISRNKMKFSTLPYVNVRSYTYAPQQPMDVADSLAVGEVLDLSSEDNLTGVTLTRKATDFAVFTAGETELTEGTDYTVSGGKLTFLKPQTEKVFVRLVTKAFPYFKTSKTYRFVTTDFTVYQKESTTDGISSVGLSSTAKPVARYNLRGQRISAPQRGINIIIYTDGTARKELVR